MQISDTATSLGDSLGLDLENEPQHTVCGGVLRSHVHHDALVGGALGGSGDDIVPILARHRESLFAIGDTGHQLYSRRWSGGGMLAPLYSTGIPPSG